MAKGTRYFIEDGILHVQTFIEWWEHYGKPILVEIVDTPEAAVARGAELPTGIAQAPIASLGPSNLHTPEYRKGYWDAVREESGKFQRETLRTSEQAQLLDRVERILCPEHEPGAWGRNCERCAVVRDIRELRARPINA